jgi:hypothetical protein
MSERFLIDQIAMFRHRAAATANPHLRARHLRMVATLEARLAAGQPGGDSRETAGRLSEGGGL